MHSAGMRKAEWGRLCEKDGLHWALQIFKRQGIEWRMEVSGGEGYTGRKTHDILGVEGIGR